MTKFLGSRHARSSVRIAVVLVATLLVVGLSTAVSSAAAARMVRIVLTDGTHLEGWLLGLTVDKVRVDPDGPVSLRVIQASDVVSVELDEGETVLTYPWTAAEIPEDLGGTPEIGRTVSGSVLEPVPGGIGQFCVSGDFGRSSPLGDGYYEGFGSGFSLGFRARYNFKEHNPHESHYFVGFAYRRSTLVDDGSWDVPGLTIGDLRIQHWALEFGRTSRTFANESYAYCLFGVGGLSNALDGTIDGYDTITVTDGQMLFRLAGGVVIGVTPTIGVDLGLSWDLVYGGTRPVSEYSMEGDMVTNGSILVLSAGLIFDL